MLVQWVSIGDTPIELPDSSCDELKEIEAFKGEVPTSDDDVPDVDLSEDPVRGGEESVLGENFPVSEEQRSDSGVTDIGMKPWLLKNGWSRASRAWMRLSESKINIFFTNLVVFYFDWIYILKVLWNYEYIFWSFGTWTDVLGAWFLVFESISLTIWRAIYFWFDRW